MNIFEKNRVIFECLEHFISKMDKPEDIHQACIVAGQYAMHRHTGYWASKVIEEAYQRISIEEDYGTEYEKDSILFVITENPEGGYINCVRNSFNVLEKRYKADIFNVNYDLKVPLIERARKLKEVASKYEKILLYPNFLDPMAILAFSKNFHRPIMSINACNTIFNIGDSVADLWLDGGLVDIDRSIDQRGIDASRIRLYPLKAPKPNDNLKSKEEVRQILQLPEGHKLLFSCGGWHKYIPIDDYRNFFHLCKEILESDETIHIVAAGFPPKHCPFYKSIVNLHPRFHSTDYVNRQDYWDLMNTCDIYLDSYPINGCTTQVEAAVMRKPIITLSARGMTPAAFHQNLCKDIPEAIERVKGYLSGALRIDYEELFEHYHGSGWEDIITEAIDSCPDTHKLWETKPNPDNIENEIDLALSRENNLEWSLYFNNTILADPKFELLKIIQRFSIENNKGLTYKSYIQ